MTIRAFIRNSYPYELLDHFADYRRWRARRFSGPSPHLIKQACLVRNGIPNAIWVETGTYLGQMTRLLSNYASHVYSIEPEPVLFAMAKKRFEAVRNIEVINGTSETVFPSLLKTIRGNVNFWLDGHYSAGNTFKGQKDTPILEELMCVGENLSRFEMVRVLVDDVHCFDPRLPGYASYPSLDVLVDWARTHKLHWHIENDIFVAKN